MKRIVQIILLCTLGMMPGVQGALAQEDARETLNANNVLSVKGGYESFDGIDNFKHFEVESLEAGNYHARFWLLPARYEEGQYTTFKVYVNGNFAGTIQPTHGNWQSASVNNQPALALSSGTNIISIATVAPESPLVESLKLSKNAQAAEISAQAYNSYLEKATETNGVLHEPMMTNATMSLPDSLILQNRVPLKYSFWTKESFSKGDTLIINSSSSVEHAIDVFLCGTNLFSDILAITDEEKSIAENRAIPIPPPYSKPVEYDREPTPNEIQGLNWKRIAGRIVPFSYTATLQIIIPKSGYYIIKLRPTTNQVLSVADITINGASYDNIPIYYARRELSMPADSCNYTAVTISQNPEDDDPMLFIEGADGDRIVGYNDESSYTQIGGYNLGNWDAAITQPYRIKTTGLHVCSYSSSFPESYCYILGHIQDTELVTESSFTPSKVRSSVAPKATTTIESAKFENSVSIIPHVANLTSSVTISSQEGISLVRVFNLSGVEVAVCPVDNYNATVALSDLNIHTAGIYLFQVECVDGSVTQQKVLVQ